MKSKFELLLCTILALLWAVYGLQMQATSAGPNVQKPNGGSDPADVKASSYSVLQMWTTESTRKAPSKESGGNHEVSISHLQGGRKNELGARGSSLSLSSITSTTATPQSTTAPATAAAAFTRSTPLTAATALPVPITIAPTTAPLQKQILQIQFSHMTTTHGLARFPPFAAEQTKRTSVILATTVSTSREPVQPAVTRNNIFGESTQNAHPGWNSAWNRIFAIRDPSTTIPSSTFQRSTQAVPQALTATAGSTNGWWRLALNVPTSSAPGGTNFQQPHASVSSITTSPTNAASRDLGNGFSPSAIPAEAHRQHPTQAQETMTNVSAFEERRTAPISFLGPETSSHQQKTNTDTGVDPGFALASATMRATASAIGSCVCTCPIQPSASSQGPVARFARAESKDGLSIGNQLSVSTVSSILTVSSPAPPVQVPMQNRGFHPSEQRAQGELSAFQANSGQAHFG